MSIQSEAALEAGLIATLRQMDYEYVQITEEDNLYANFKRQLEIHNKKQLAEVGRNSFTDEEFEKILICLEGGTRFEKAKKLRDLGIRVDVDERNEKMQYKIRQSQTSKIPYQLIVGDKEMADKTVNVRRYGSKQTHTESVDAFVENILADIARKSRPAK